MLVLTRKVDETIIVSHPAGDIVITLTKIKDYRRALIGIDAPSEVSVRRGELVDA